MKQDTALLVSPLKLLMKSQVADLSKLVGGGRVDLLKETTVEGYNNIEKGDYSIVFANPEILQEKKPSLLSNSVFCRRICGIFIGEVHGPHRKKIIP